ncbi:MAG: hypothetical protein AB1894_16725 [Chloroflexota bacterium]
MDISPTPPTGSSRTALACAILVSIFIALSLWDRAFDDPFITYRYARNLAQGAGFVYNPGERVLSTSTPLFTLLLATVFPLWQDLPHLANLIGAFSLGIGGFFLWRLGNSWEMNLESWVLLLLYPTFPLITGTLGSETPLYLALCLGAFASYARENQLLAATLSALAVLTRPDGALIPIILSFYYVLKKHRLPSRKAIAIFGCLTLPWFVFAWIYFGHPLPATLFAKHHQGALPVSQHFLPGLATIASWYAKNLYFQLEIALSIIGLAFVIWRKRQWAPLLAWVTVYSLAYQTLGVSRYFWYYAPLIPVFIILVTLGLAFLAHIKDSPVLSVKLPALKNFSRWGPIAISVLLIGSQAQALRLARDQNSLILPFYRSIGEWLNAHTPPDARVGMLEVGIIGYYAQRPVIDFAGLIQPDVAAQMNPSTTYQDAALWAVHQYQPEYVVLHANAFPDLEKGYIAQNCLLVKIFPGQPYGYSTDMHIYDCQGHPTTKPSSGF